jgi:hypothetical protein
MSAEILPVTSRRAARRRRGQHVRDAIIAGVLIFEGAEALRDTHPHGMILPILLVAAGALVLGTMLYEQLHHFRHGGHEGQAKAWVEIAGVVLAAAESLKQAWGRHHLSFYVLSALGPILIGYFVYLDVRGVTTTYMKIDDDVFVLRLRKLFSRRVRLSNMSAFRVGEKSIDFIGDDGRVQKVNIGDLVNRDEAVAWASERLLQRGLAQE